MYLYTRVDLFVRVEVPRRRHVTQEESRILTDPLNEQTARDGRREIETQYEEEAW